MRCATNGGVRSLAIAALLFMGFAACAPPPPRSKVGPPEPATCVGGLCVKPDHTVARKVKTERGSRCVILAWDGDAALPPTAKMGVTDDSPARPGVFLSIEIPSLIDGVPYRISEPNTASPTTTVVAVRVDPAVKFADQRMAEKGEVMVTSSGDDMLVQVKTIWGATEEKAMIIVPRAHNTCGMPVRVD